MSDGLIKKITKESMYFLIFTFIMLIIFKIVFYNEKMIVILRTVMGFVIFFVLPGFCLMYYWEERLGFLERLIVGTFLNIGIIGISSYYLGIAGIHIKYHIFIIFFILAIIDILLIRKKTKKNVSVS